MVHRPITVELNGFETFAKLRLFFLCSSLPLQLSSGIISRGNKGNTMWLSLDDVLIMGVWFPSKLFNSMLQRHRNVRSTKYGSIKLIVMPLLQSHWKWLELMRQHRLSRAGLKATVQYHIPSLVDVHWPAYILNTPVGSSRYSGYYGHNVVNTWRRDAFSLVTHQLLKYGNLWPEASTSNRINYPLITWLSNSTVIQIT